MKTYTVHSRLPVSRYLRQGDPTAINLRIKRLLGSKGVEKEQRIVN